MIICVLAECTDTGPKEVGPAWPEYRVDLARDGHPQRSAFDAGVAAHLALAWRTHLDGAVDGTPAIARGRVIAGSAGGTLEAIDEASGRQAWAIHELGAIASSPTIAGDRVYVTTLTGAAYAFGVERGDLMWKWTAPPESALWASPVVYRDEVIVGISSPYGDQPLVAGRIYALDAKSGRVRWTACMRTDCAPGDGIWSTAAIDAVGTAFVGVGNPDDGVLAFDAMTGQRRWLSPLYADRGRDLDVGASPVVFTLDGREVVAQATVEGMLALLDARAGALVWARELVAGSAVHGLLASPGYDGTSLYAPSASDPTGIIAVNPGDGSIRWGQVTDLPVYSAPAVGDGVVLFGTGGVFGDLSTGSVEAVSAIDGSRLWNFDTHSAVRSGPALSGDVLVVGDYAGDLMEFAPAGRA